MPSGTVVVGDISGIFTCIFVIGDFLSGGDIFFFFFMFLTQPPQSIVCLIKCYLSSTIYPLI